MKTVKLFLVILLGIVFLQSCSQEELNSEKMEINIDSVTPSNLDQYLEEGYKAYAKEFPNHHVEVVTLEDMNKIYVEHGLEPLGEEDFSKEHWEILQDPDRVLPRCTSGMSVFLGDVNSSGTLSTSDLVEASAEVNFSDSTYGTCCDKISDSSFLPNNYFKFGLFSSWHGICCDSPSNGFWTLSSYPLSSSGFQPKSDVERARLHVLGILPC